MFHVSVTDVLKDLSHIIGTKSLFPEDSKTKSVPPSLKYFVEVYILYIGDCQFSKNLGKFIS